MVLSRRERYVLIGTAIAVGALALDRLVVSSLWDSRSAAMGQRAKLTVKLKDARNLIDLRQRVGPKWEQMTRAGLKNDPGEAESQVLRAVRDWTEQCHLSLTLLKPDRSLTKTRLPEITLQASGTGNMEGIRQFLWRIRTAGIPLKATEVVINARKEGLDDLTFQIRLSTIYSPPRPSATSAPGGASGAPGGV